MNVFANEAVMRRKQDKLNLSLLLSVLFHLVAMLLIPGSGAPGVPGGTGSITKTEVYSLAYLGEWDESDDGRASGRLGVETVFAEVGSEKVAPQPRKEPKASSKPKSPTDTADPKRKAELMTKATPSTLPATLTSAAGAFDVPNSEHQEPPLQKTSSAGSAERGLQPEESTRQGTSGVVAGEGSGPVAPPAGSSMFQAGEMPKYPKNAANEGIEGTVSLKIHASTSGNIVTVEVSQSAGDRRLDDIAVRTIKSWRLKPYDQAYVLNVAVQFMGGSRVHVNYGDVQLLPALGS